MFKEKLEEARISEAQKVADVSIIDPAVMPTSPVNQGGSEMNMIIGGIVGLLLGIGLAFIIESVDTSLGTIEDIENISHIKKNNIMKCYKLVLDSELSGFLQQRDDDVSQ